MKVGFSAERREKKKEKHKLTHIQNGSGDKKLGFFFKEKARIMVGTKITIKSEWRSYTRLHEPVWF